MCNPTVLVELLLMTFIHQCGGVDFIQDSLSDLDVNIPKKPSHLREALIRTREAISILRAAL